ncbi:MAG: DinB family protein [Chloroflexota bacterium]
MERRSSRAASLAADLRRAAARLSTQLQPIGAARWNQVSAPGTWSIGKDVEHVVEALGYHEWIVRRTIGDTVPSRRPSLERSRMTSGIGPEDGVDLMRRRARHVERLILRLTDAQLDLPTRPSRANAQSLAVTIERVLIGHLDTHRTSIEDKLHR